MERRIRLRQARLAAGLTQHELAERTGIAQSSIAAYESGARAPSEVSCQRILTATQIRPSTLLAARRDELIEHLTDHGITDVAVFGSVSRDDDDEGSDIDLLVTLPPGIGMFGLVAIQERIEQILGTDCDVISRGSLQPELFSLHRQVLDEAVPV